VKYYLGQCLHSLVKALENIESEIIVVDNHSSDGSIEYLKSKFPVVKYIHCGHNMGFSRANNIGIKQSCGELVLMINPDTIVGEDVVINAVNFLQMHDSAGALGVKMLKADGSNAMESRRGLPTPMTAFYKMSGLCERFPHNHKLAHYYMSYLSWSEPHKIEVISGAFYMIRRKAYDDVGGLDEDYFMYGEDVDLSCRLLEKGWQNWYLPLSILHYKGESTQKTSFRYVHVFYESMLIFMRKHYSNSSYFINFPVKMAIFFKAMMALLKNGIFEVSRSLGFRTKDKLPSATYVFIGGKEMLEQCKCIALNNGLDAEFINGSQESYPEGHLRNMHSDPYRMIYAVYDMTVYSYSHLLGIFASCPMKHVSVGTYYNNVLITAEEVMCYE
jgi:GT2 family glycosyltransferase